MSKKNVVIIEKRDEWSAFGEFLAEIIAKYSDEVSLDDLPDPDVFFARKYIKDAYKAYMRHVREITCEKAMESIEYVLVG
ncbi:hypothetical protein [Butyrivibrio proteoclasticus]|uniref:hypothetical protein n=1 Tax=Butyrivibrio proteoclasticus TaxID=43305 RepID=UPI00047AF41D|nr:hypothetical protein [Butyrivibrio proteoclasticus]